jgi:hypothetical protein
VSVRGPLARMLLGIGLFCGGSLAVAGGLALGGPGMVAVAVAAALAGCTAAGIAREAPVPDRRSTVEWAVQAAGWTAGVLMVVAGVAALAGGVVAALAVGVGLAVVLAVRAGRVRCRPAADRDVTPPTPAPSWPVGVDVLLLPVPPEEPPAGRDDNSGAARLLPPVAGLPTRALGEEWQFTTAALAARLGPAARQWLVGRREAVLDELERRDPAGFARWLATGPTRGSDPAEWVHGGPVHDGPAAGTDAA